MELKLTQNKIALIDLDDSERINKNKWYYHHTGYAIRNSRTVNGKRKTIYLHREVMGVKDGTYIDHINLNKLDNRKCNLRIATYANNNCNKTHQKNNTTGYKGVTKRPNYNKWRAYITKNRHRIWLGDHDSPEQAAKAHNEAALRLHGQFAHLNPIEIT